jgi:hypothetical protein
MKRGFFLSQSKSASSAAQPASDGNAAQLASDGSAAQPSITSCSIADVHSWFKANTAAVGSSVEAERIKAVVEVLNARPNPRKEDVQEFFNSWGVKQKFQKKPRPLAECIQELSTKVVEAAIKLQADLSSMVSSAEQLGASSATPPAPQDPFFDILLASRRCIDLHENESGTPNGEGILEKPPSELLERPKKAFGLLQDCRKYKEHNWVVGEDEKKLGKIMRELVIESQPHCSSQMCRELYNLTNVGKILLGPFRERGPQGHWQEMDHEHVRCVTFNGCTIPDLVSFLSGRDVQLADEYPYMAGLATLGVKVVGKSRQKIYEEKVLEILKNMPKTEDLPLLQDYARHEWLYRMLADKRDKAAGIPIEGSEALELFCQEVRKCRKEDEKNSEEDPEWREYEDKNRRTSQFRDECRRKWKEQGKTEEQCRRM